MGPTYWHKQTKNNPLFPDLLWSRPENKRLAGKLVILGGSISGFSSLAIAFQAASEAGAGSLRVVAPDRIAKLVGGWNEVFFAQSSKSGSFSSGALAEWLEHAEWADATLLAGNFGHNSETAILIEKFLNSYKGQAVLTGDALDLLLTSPDALWLRPRTLLVPTFVQLQKLITKTKSKHAVTLNMDLLRLVETLSGLTSTTETSIILEYSGQIVAATGGRVVTTQDKTTTRPVELAAASAVWLMQNPDKVHEALACASLEAHLQ